jgi:hypothetical protein
MIDSEAGTFTQGRAEVLGKPDFILDDKNAHINLHEATYNCLAWLNQTYATQDADGRQSVLRPTSLHSGGEPARVQTRSRRAKIKEAQFDCGTRRSIMPVALIAIWRSVSEVFDVSNESGRAMGRGAVFCEAQEMLTLRGKCMILLVNCRHLS